MPDEKENGEPQTAAAGSGDAPKLLPMEEAPQDGTWVLVFEEDDDLTRSREIVVSARAARWMLWASARHMSGTEMGTGQITALIAHPIGWLPMPEGWPKPYTGPLQPPGQGA